ncbi:MAG TPA: hypothetical protein PKH78_09855, partial [Candidatus Obscuribacter sp.]|nr:hypothetical protein [Candidatus Obscuribacter sp.]
MVKVVGKGRPTKEAEISALRRAIAVERRARYADFQGRHSTFSHFMRVTSDRLVRRFPLDPVWTTLRAFFRQYPNADVATRINIVSRAEELLVPYFEAMGAEPATGADAAAVGANAGASGATAGAVGANAAAVGANAGPSGATAGAVGATRSEPARGL